MKDKTVLTAESVTAGHPDKLCDTIADTVLDCCLEHDPQARVACEVMATAGRFIVAGEITAQAAPDIPAVVRDTVRRAGYGCGDLDIEVLIHPQSPDIAGAVESSGQMGAGDQGIMYGYACNETDALLPLPVVLAHRLTSLLACARTMGWIDGLLPDGKAQVSVEYEFGVPRRIAAIVLSCQRTEDKDLSALREELREFVITPALRIFPADADTGIYINPSGRFVLGGFEADTGLTGRKLMVDTYGGLAPHGGGALSGKDGEGGPQRGIHGTLHCEKHRCRRSCGEMHRHSGLRHWKGRACCRGCGYPPHRHLPRRGTGTGCAAPVRPHACGHDPHPGTGSAHLRPVLQLRSLHPPVRSLGADGQDPGAGGRLPLPGDGGNERRGEVAQIKEHRAIEYGRFPIR